jgi:hypothetical protein
MPSLNLDLEQLASWQARPSTPMGFRSALTAYRGVPSATCWPSALSRRCRRHACTIYGRSRRSSIAGYRSVSGKSLSMTNFTSANTRQLHQLDIRLSGHLVYRPDWQRAVLSVCGTGGAAARRPDRRFDAVRRRFQRESGASPTRRSPGSQSEWRPLPDRRGRLARARGTFLFI